MQLATRLIAVLFALALAALGALLAVEAFWALVQTATDGLLVPWRGIQNTLNSVTWQDPAVRSVSLGVAIVGLLLLALALTARSRDVRLHDPAPEVTVVTDSQSLARLVEHHVQDQDGVTGARVRAKGRRVQVKAAAQFNVTEELRTRVVQAARQAVQHLPLRTAPRVSVSVQSRGRR